jgi:hypothetical protein
MIETKIFKLGENVEYFSEMEQKFITGIIREIGANNIEICLDYEDKNNKRTKTIYDLDNVKISTSKGYTRVVSADIGVNTGITVMDFYKTYLGTYIVKVTNMLTVDTTYKLYENIFRQMKTSNIPSKLQSTILVYEDFRSSVFDRNQKISIENIGVFKYLAYKNNYIIHGQMPSVRTGYLQLAKKVVKKYQKQFNLNTDEKRHVVDSTAHLLRFLNKEVNINVQNIF